MRHRAFDFAPSEFRRTATVEAKLAQRSERSFETYNPQNVQEHWPAE